jgi:hypothetical protein
VRQHKGEHVLKKEPWYACKVGAPGLGKQTRGGDGARPRVAKRALSGVAGVAGPARDRVRALENEHAGSRTPRRSHHRAKRHHRGWCLGSPQRNADELSSVEGNER